MMTTTNGSRELSSLFMDAQEAGRLCRTESWLLLNATQDTAGPSYCSMSTSASDPSLVDLSGVMSPVSNLAKHFSNQSLNSTPRRRLSLDGSESSASISPPMVDFAPHSLVAPRTHVLTSVPEHEDDEDVSDRAASSLNYTLSDGRSTTAEVAGNAGESEVASIGANFTFSRVVCSLKSRTVSTPAIRLDGDERQMPTPAMKINFEPSDFRMDAGGSADGRWLLGGALATASEHSGSPAALSVSSSSVFEPEEDEPQPIAARLRTTTTTAAMDDGTRDSGYDGSSEAVRFDDEPAGSPTSFAAFAVPADPPTGGTVSNTPTRTGGGRRKPFERKRSMECGKNVINIYECMQTEDAVNDKENMSCQMMQELFSSKPSSAYLRRQKENFKRKATDEEMATCNSDVAFRFPSTTAAAVPAVRRRRRPLASIGNQLRANSNDDCSSSDSCDVAAHAKIALDSPKRSKLVHRKTGLSLLRAGLPIRSAVSLTTDATRKRSKQPSGSSCSRLYPSSPQSLSIDVDAVEQTPTPLDKRRKPTATEADVAVSRSLLHPPPFVHRCYSESAIPPSGDAGGQVEANDDLVDLLHGDFNLVGDFSQNHSLPLINRPKISDTKSISRETLDALLQNSKQFTDKDVLLVDCRYPYEYNGGHIQGAINIHESNVLVETMFGAGAAAHGSSSSLNGRMIIFYCEYSQKRGPAMLRHTRRCDRESNTYPQLNYPEIYLLEDGYLSFYQKFSHQCSPQAHVRMIDDPEQLRKFRVRSKSWACAAVGGTDVKPLHHHQRPGLGGKRGLFR